jgi:predicted N-acetyltransferase YhbS
MSPRPIEDVLIREMTLDDLPGADNLRHLAGWNQTTADWRRLLSLEPQGCFVAGRQGRIIGSVTTTTHGPSLAWIGMMLVHPDERGRGIGAALLRSAISRLERAGVRCVKLDATPLGQPLYEKCGFVPEATLQRWHRVAEPQAHSLGPFSSFPSFPSFAALHLPGAEEHLAHAAFESADTRPLTGSDWPAVERMDARAFGAPRSALLHRLAEEARSVLIWPATGAIGGYGMLRPGVRAFYLGPGVCASPEGVAVLVAALLREAGGAPVFWDILDQCGPAKEAARRFGFAPARPLTRMRRGSDVPAGDPNAQFAIADPAVG